MVFFSLAVTDDDHVFRLNRFLLCFFGQSIVSCLDFRASFHSERSGRLILTVCAVKSIQIQEHRDGWSKMGAWCAGHPRNTPPLKSGSASLFTSKTAGTWKNLYFHSKIFKFDITPASTARKRLLVLFASIRRKFMIKFSTLKLLNKIQRINFCHWLIGQNL